MDNPAHTQIPISVSISSEDEVTSTQSMSNESILDSDHEMVISVVVDNTSYKEDSVVEETSERNVGSCQTKEITAKENRQGKEGSCIDSTTVSNESILDSDHEMVISVVVDNTSYKEDSVVEETSERNVGSCQTKEITAKENRQGKEGSCIDSTTVSNESILDSDHEMVISVVVDNTSYKEDSVVEETSERNVGSCQTKEITAKENRQGKEGSCIDSTTVSTESILDSDHGMVTSVDNASNKDDSVVEETSERNVGSCQTKEITAKENRQGKEGSCIDSTTVSTESILDSDHGMVTSVGNTSYKEDSMVEETSERNVGSCQTKEITAKENMQGKEGSCIDSTTVSTESILDRDHGMVTSVDNTSYKEDSVVEETSERNVGSCQTKEITGKENMQGKEGSCIDSTTVSTESILDRDHGMVTSVDNTSYKEDSVVEETSERNVGSCQTKEITAKENRQGKEGSCIDSTSTCSSKDLELMDTTDSRCSRRNCLDEFLTFINVNNSTQSMQQISAENVKDKISNRTCLRKVIKKNTCPASAMVQTASRNDLSSNTTDPTSSMIQMDDRKEISLNSPEPKNDVRTSEASGSVIRHEKRKLDTSEDEVLQGNIPKKQCIEEESYGKCMQEKYMSSVSSVVADKSLESSGTNPTSLYESIGTNEQSNLSIQDHNSESALHHKDDDSGEDSAPESKVCYICFRDFSSKLKMEEHVRDEHSYFPFAPANTCTHCGSCFTSRSDVSSHEYKTHSLTLSCPFCGIIHQDKEHLQIHVVVHLSPLTYVCMKCQEHFLTVDDVEFHIFKSHGESALWADYLKCRFCNCLFGKRDKLYSHIINLHSRIFLHKCNSCLQAFYSHNALLVHRSNENNILEGQKIVIDEHFEIDFQKLRVRLDESTKDNVAHVNKRLVKIQKKKIYGNGLTWEESDDEKEEDKVYSEKKLPEVLGISIDNTDEGKRKGTTMVVSDRVTSSSHAFSGRLPTMGAVSTCSKDSDSRCTSSSEDLMSYSSKYNKMSTEETEGFQVDIDLLNFARKIPIVKQKPLEERNISVENSAQKSSDAEESLVSSVSERILQEKSIDVSNMNHAMVKQLQRNLQEAQARLKAIEDAMQIQTTDRSNLTESMQENQQLKTKRFYSTDDDDLPFLSAHRQKKQRERSFKRIVVDDESDDDDLMQVNHNDNNNVYENNGCRVLLSTPKHSGTIKLNHRNCSVTEILEVKRKIMEVLDFRSPILLLHRCDYLLSNRAKASDTGSDDEQMAPASVKVANNLQEDYRKKPPITRIGVERDKVMSRSLVRQTNVTAKVLSPPPELIGMLEPRRKLTQRNFSELSDHEDDFFEHHRLQGRSTSLQERGQSRNSSSSLSGDSFAQERKQKSSDKRLSSAYQRKKMQAKDRKKEAQKRRLSGLRSSTRSLGLRSRDEGRGDGTEIDKEDVRKKQLEKLAKQRKALKFKKSVSTRNQMHAKHHMHAKSMSITPGKTKPSRKGMDRERTELRKYKKSVSTRSQMHAKSILKSPKKTRLSPMLKTSERTNPLIKEKISVNTRSQMHAASVLQTPEKVKNLNLRKSARVAKLRKSKHGVSTRSQKHANSVSKTPERIDAANKGVLAEKNKARNKDNITYRDTNMNSKEDNPKDKPSLENPNSSCNQDVRINQPDVTPDVEQHMEEGTENETDNDRSSVSIIQGDADQDFIMDCEEIPSESQDDILDGTQDYMEEDEDCCYMGTERKQDEDSVPIVIDEDSSNDGDGMEDTDEALSSGERCLKLIHVFNSDAFSNNEELLPDEQIEPEEPLSVKTEIVSPQKERSAHVVIDPDSLHDGESMQDENEVSSSGERCLKLVHVFNSEASCMINSEEILPDEDQEFEAPVIVKTETASPQKTFDVTSSSTLRNCDTSSTGIQYASPNDIVNFNKQVEKQCSPVDESFLLGLVDMQERHSREVRIVGKTLTGDEILVERVGRRETESSNENEAEIESAETEIGGIHLRYVKMEPCDVLEKLEEIQTTTKTCLKVKNEPDPSTLNSTSISYISDSKGRSVPYVSDFEEDLVTSLPNTSTVQTPQSTRNDLFHSMRSSSPIRCQLSEPNITMSLQTHSEPICMISSVFSLNKGKSYLREHGPNDSMSAHQMQHKGARFQCTKQDKQNRKLVPFTQYIQNSGISEKMFLDHDDQKSKKVQQMPLILPSIIRNTLSTVPNSSNSKTAFVQDQQSVRKMKNQFNVQPALGNQVHNRQLPESTDQHHTLSQPQQYSSHPLVWGQQPVGNQSQKIGSKVGIAQPNVQTFRQEPARQEIQHPIQNVQPAQNLAQQAKSTNSMLGAQHRQGLTNTLGESLAQQSHTQQQNIVSQGKLKQIEHQKMLFSGSQGKKSQQQMQPPSTTFQAQQQGTGHNVLQQVCPPYYQYQNNNLSHIPSMYAPRQPVFTAQHAQMQNRYQSPSTTVHHQIAPSLSSGQQIQSQSMSSVRNLLGFNLRTRLPPSQYPITTQALPHVSGANMARVPPNNVYRQIYPPANPIQQQSNLTSPVVHSNTPIMNSLSTFTQGGNSSQVFIPQQITPSQSHHNMAGLASQSSTTSSGMHSHSQNVQQIIVPSNTVNSTLPWFPVQAAYPLMQQSSQIPIANVVSPQISGSNIVSPQISGSNIVSPQISGSNIVNPQISGSNIVNPQVSSSDTFISHISSSNVVTPLTSTNTSIQEGGSGQNRLTLSKHSLSKLKSIVTAFCEEKKLSNTSGVGTVTTQDSSFLQDYSSS